MLTVPDCLNQAAMTEPGDTNRPMLNLSTWNGAPIDLRRASMTRRSVLAPTTLLCFPHPVKMLQRENSLSQKWLDACFYSIRSMYGEVQNKFLFNLSTNPSL